MYKTLTISRTFSWGLPPCKPPSVDSPPILTLLRTNCRKKAVPSCSGPPAHLTVQAHSQELEWGGPGRVPASTQTPLSAPLLHRAGDSSESAWCGQCQVSNPPLTQSDPLVPPKALGPFTFGVKKSGGALDSISSDIGWEVTKCPYSKKNLS